MKTPKILCLLFLLGLFSVGSLLLPGTAHADVTCSATSSTINFGTVDPNAGAQTQVTVYFTCSQTNKLFASAANVTMCVSIGTGSGGQINPRLMSNGSNPKLQFQLYTQASRTAVWGSFNSSIPPYQIPSFTVPGAIIGIGGDYSGNFTVYGTVPAGQTGIVSGSYANSMNDSFLTFNSSTSSTPATCGTGNDGSFTLTASAVVQQTCTVSATDISFGAHPATDANLQSTGTVTVTCVNGTTYNVGLSPSNGNTGGAGVMSGTGGNTDKVPYQLHQTGYSGPVWGNTATSTSTGNGVHGTGSGSGQAFTVYAVVPTADYTPDNYSDTVTVNVNY